MAASQLKYCAKCKKKTEWKAVRIVSAAQVAIATGLRCLTCGRVFSTKGG